MTVSRLLVLVSLTAAAHVAAAPPEGAVGPSLAGAEPAAASEPVPQSVEELWADFDPRQDPLETEVIREWREDGGVFRDLVLEPHRPVAAVDEQTPGAQSCGPTISRTATRPPPQPARAGSRRVLPTSGAMNPGPRNASRGGRDCSWSLWRPQGRAPQAS